MLRLLRLGVIAATLASAGVAHTQSAEPYPSGPVKMVVAYAAGNTGDILARMLNEPLGKRLNQPVVVENRPGVGGSLGTSVAAKSKPDGQTLLLSAVAAMAINPHVYDNVGYDSLKDFEYLRLVAWAPSVCVVAAESPIKSIDDLVAASKRKELNYGTSGVGTMPHLTVEILKQRLSLNATMIPYKGAAAVMTDLVGGQIDVTCESLGAARTLIDSGRLRPIMVTSEKRLPALPHVPTVSERIPGLVLGAWIGILAPKGVPQPIVERLQSELQLVLADTELRSKIEGMGLEVLNQGPASFMELARKDFEVYGRLARELKLKP